MQEQVYNPEDYPDSAAGINEATAPKAPEEFKKVSMQPYGLVLMNQKTGEIRGLDGTVIKPPRE